MKGVKTRGSVKMKVDGWLRLDCLCGGDAGAATSDGTLDGPSAG